MNKYLSYDEQRAPKVRAMFSRLAWRYDVVNDVMSFGLHRRWKRETVRIAFEGRPPGARLLDLCCGTGDIGFLAEETKGARVRGLDFTLPMLWSRAAAGRADRGPHSPGRPGAPLPDATFDVITVGYGLAASRIRRRHSSSAKRARAGRKTVILDFGSPKTRSPPRSAGLPANDDARRGLVSTRPGPISTSGVSERYRPARRRGLDAERQLSNVRYENRLLGTMGINMEKPRTVKR
jgi:SAM-dependent methyltransferase